MSDGFDSGPFSMLDVSALENAVGAVNIWGHEYAAIQWADGVSVTQLMVFCRGLLKYDDHQVLKLRTAERGLVEIKEGDTIVMRARTVYDVLRTDVPVSLFGTMPTTPRSTSEERMARIAEAHTPKAGPGGFTDGLCPECNWNDPCPTKVWATTDREVLGPWDPADDEEGVEDGA